MEKSLTTMRACSTGTHVPNLEKQEREKSVVVPGQRVGVWRADPNPETPSERSCQLCPLSGLYIQMAESLAKRQQSRWVLATQPG